MRRKHTPDLPNACPICSPIRCVKASGRKTIRTKRKIRYINATPTWASLVPLMIHVIQDANYPGRADILGEMLRMAQAADSYNRLVKELKARGIK